MEIKILQCRVDPQTLGPNLVFTVDLIYDVGKAPVSISGSLKTGSDGKVISFLNENGSYYDFQLMGKEIRPAYFGNITTKNIQLELTATLSPKALEHIEKLRENDHEKSVRLNLDLFVKVLEITSDYRVTDYLQLANRRQHANYEIKQSDWIKNYSAKLGMGSFVLLELQVPEKKEVPKYWEELYNLLGQNVKDMENAIHNGDWQKTMFFARKFYENVKIGDSKPGHKKFKEQFDLLMAKDQHGEEGIKNLYDAIWHFFEFVSKYVHDKDKKGNVNPLPVSTKEDAYFAYTLALGLLNLIGKKLSE